MYCADHTYTTLKLQMDSTVDQIIQYAADKIGDDRDLVLCEVKSTGGTNLKAKCNFSIDVIDQVLLTRKDLRLNPNF